MYNVLKGVLNFWPFNVRKFNQIPSTPPAPTTDPRFTYSPLARVFSVNPPTRQFGFDPLPRQFTTNPPTRIFIYNPLKRVQNVV